MNRWKSVNFSGTKVGNFLAMIDHKYEMSFVCRAVAVAKAGHSSLVIFRFSLSTNARPARITRQTSPLLFRVLQFALA